MSCPSESINVSETPCKIGADSSSVSDKRILLKLHPDKNPGCVANATAKFQEY